MAKFTVGDKVVFRSGASVPRIVAAIAPDGRLFLLDRHGPLTAQPGEVMQEDEFIAIMKRKEAERKDK